MAKSYRTQAEAVRDHRPAWDGTAQAAAIIEAHRAMPGAMLPLLHALQAEFGCVPSEAEPMIATALNLSRAEVFGVISFYHDFRREPAGRHVLKLCRAEACQAMGAVALAERLLGRLGLPWGGTAAGGALTVEPTYCLGLCACAPAALYDGEPVAGLTHAKLESIVLGALA